MEHKIQDLFEFIRNGANIKQGEPGGYPITRIETISSGEINRNKMGYAGLTDLKKYENYILEDQDLLMSHINSEKHLGKCAIYHKKDNEIIIHGMNLLGLRVKKEMILPKFAVYLFQTNKFKKSLSKIIKKSVNQASFAVNDLKKIKVDIPDIEQQQRIVSILDSCISLKRKRQSQITALDELTKSLFLEMFGDPINNPKKWEMKKLKDVTDKILSGSTPKGGSKVYTENGITFLRSQNVWKNRLNLDDVVYIDKETHNKMINSSLKYGDILMTKTGRINTENSSLGRAAIFRGKDDSANINGHVYLIRLQKAIINEFILFILTTDEYREYIRSVCVGGIDKRQINKEHLEKFPIIWPPVELQVQFSKQLTHAETLKSKMKISLKELEDTFNSILQCAFKGELFQA